MNPVLAWSLMTPVVAATGAAIFKKDPDRWHVPAEFDDLIPSIIGAVIMSAAWWGIYCLYA